jgi:hypothetical protein
MMTRTRIVAAAWALSIAACSTAARRDDGPPATPAPARPQAPAVPAAAPRAATGMIVYVDPANRFRFEHPSELAVVTGSAEPTSGWRAETTTNGLLLAQSEIRKEAQQNTNFAGAKFTVGMSTDPTAVRDCVRDAPGDQARSATLTLHGRTFTQLAFSDAGAGNFYDTTSYRHVDKGECWVVEYTMHSTNLGNYPPDRGVKAFDRVKVAAELEAMARSFELP